MSVATDASKQSSASSSDPIKHSTFRPAVLGDKHKLSAATKAEILELLGARPVRFVRELVVTWLAVILIIAVGLYVNHWAVTLLCIFLIGTRQMVLGLLLHEQVHRLGLRGKYGDWIVNITAVYPIIVTTVEDYAKVHLSHHKYFFTHKDPDHLRKAGDEWTFPTTLTKALRIVLRDVTGLNTMRLIRGKTAPSDVAEFTRPHPSPKWLRPAFFIGLAVLLTALDAWMVFLVYWLLPLLTVTQLLVRWLAVCEHSYNMENATVFESTPLIKLKFWQRLLIPDLNFAMHVYHHLHPGVSFANLPAVHELYRREGLVDDSAVFDGQGAYLKYLVQSPAKSSTTN